MSLWRRLFGKSQKEAWGELAAQLDGAFVAGGMLGTHKVTARLGGFDLVLDTYTVSTGQTSMVYTRLSAPFINGTGLRMSVHRASFFSPLARALGKQDIEVGDALFDRDLVISGNDEAGVRLVLADPALRALMLAQPRIRLEIADDEGMFGARYGSRVDLLRFTEVDVIKDVDRLRGLFSVFAALLHALGTDTDASALAVPPAQVAPTFHALLDDVFESLGARSERVGDTFEARLPDPLGVVPGEARAVLSTPTLPALTSSLTFDAPLPLGKGSLRVEKRGLLARGDVTCGDDAADGALALTGDGGLAVRISHALARLAPHAPRVDVSEDRVSVQVADFDAAAGAVVVGATLELWQELVRARTGLLG